MEACGIVDCLFANPPASEDEEEDGVLLVEAAEADEVVFPPIRSRK